MEQTTQTRDVYALVTDHIISQLQKGIIPWRKNWFEAGLPENLISKHPYTGINVILLASLSYEQNLFLTYKEVNEIGGKVKRGETGHMVVFWTTNDKREDTANEGVEEAMEARKAPFLRYYTVFNIAQCENIPEEFFEIKRPIKIDTMKTCKLIVDDMPNPPQIKHKEPDTYYHPGKDYVNLPQMKSFSNHENYYAALFPELIHSTGHKTRLDRKGVMQTTYFGADAYSSEELIGDIGGAYLCSYSGITYKTSADPVTSIDGWIKRIGNDKRFIMYAATQAQKAVEYILNTRKHLNGKEVLPKEK